MRSVVFLVAFSASQSGRVLQYHVDILMLALEGKFGIKKLRIPPLGTIYVRKFRVTQNG